MNTCGNYTQIHMNKSGSIGFCKGCSAFHLTIKGVLTMIHLQQLENIALSLNKMKSDLFDHHSQEPISSGVQIKLSANIYLCLSFCEIEDSIELIEMGSYMHHLQDIINS